MDAAGKWILAGVAEIGVELKAVQSLRRIERLDRHTANGGRWLLALRRGGGFFFPAITIGGVGDGGHSSPFTNLSKATGRPTFAPPPSPPRCRRPDRGRPSPVSSRAALRHTATSLGLAPQKRQSDGLARWRRR